MTDYTAAVVRLENAYSSMQIARKRVADEVKAEFAPRIRAEIAQRQADLEIAFAKELQLETERGLPGAVVRSEVLRTQDWGRWKKWRDLAEIEPDSVIRANARRERAVAERRFYWEPSDENEFGFALVLTRTRDGETMEPVTITDVREDKGKLTAWPDRTTHRTVAEAHFGGLLDMKNYASEIAEAHKEEAGS